MSNHSNLRLDKRAKALLLNDCIKIITQASWDLKIISQQYPVNTMEEDDYEQYIEFIEEQVTAFAQATAKMATILQK